MISDAASVGSLKYNFKNQPGGEGFSIAGAVGEVEGDYYGIPLYYADANTPRVAVGAKTDWWNGFKTAPIPSQATPALGTDHHLSVWDVPNKMLYEYWDMAKDGSGAWTASFGITFASDGPGYQPGPPVYLNSARAYGGSEVGGLIRYDEMKQGVINHALAIALPYPRGVEYARGLGKDGITMNIASHSDGQTDSVFNSAGNIPEGARIRLKSTVDLALKCGSNRACNVIGQALKTYGAYLLDTGGVSSVYAEILNGRNVNWNGLLSNSDIRSAFVADDFELMSLPQTLTHIP